MKHYNRSQTDQGKVLNDGCYITFASLTSISKVILLQLPSFLNSSFVNVKVVCYRRT